MNLFTFLGIFLIACGAMVIFSTLNGSGKAGVAKVQGRLTQIAKNESGKFLFTEYEFTHEGREIRVKCPNKTKASIGDTETMYYDISQNILTSEKSRKFILTVAAICIVAGIVVLYFKTPLTVLFGDGIFTKR